MNSSEYINDCYRNFAMYVLQTRAFPSIADGLKHGGRRLLWTARNGEKQKTATLAGATMPLHPHGDSSDTVDTLTKPYCNNYPLFEGIGSFGTRLKPNASGAPRYTSVKVSDFTKDVMFRDINLVPMTENYDGTLMEPIHFLPLVPVVLLNPSEGIGVGFSCTILPRSLGDVIDSQIAFLNGKKFEEPQVTFHPFEAVSVSNEVIKSGNTRWWFEGDFIRIDTSTLHIGNIPYGLEHDELVATLRGLVEADVINSFDDHSSNVISITVKFPRGALKNITDEQLFKMLKLRASLVENMNVIDFSGERVVPMSYTSIIESFTEWRLGWYVKRYEELKAATEKDIQRYRDIINAINNDVGGVGRKLPNKKALIEWLETIDVVYTEYIADLPVYRLTKEEAAKAQEKLDAALIVLAGYERLLNDPDERKKVYIQELKDVKKKHHKPLVSTKKVFSRMAKNTA